MCERAPCLLTLVLLLVFVGADQRLEVAHFERAVLVQVASAQVRRVGQPAGALEGRQLADTDVCAVALRSRGSGGSGRAGGQSNGPVGCARADPGRLIGASARSFACAAPDAKTGAIKGRVGG